MVSVVGMPETREELLALLSAVRVSVEDGARSGFSALAAAPSRAPERKAPPAPPAGLSLPFPEAVRTLEEIRSELGECTRCKLHRGRTHLVFGAGSPKAELLFVGEAPGREEDVKGEPFVGRAGLLLNDIIEAIGLKRAEVYICNVVKCRPPENRNPESDEIATCSPFLHAQIAAVGPKVICALGKFAAQVLLGAEGPISGLRGKLWDYRGVPVVPTYHPAYLLRNPNAKKEVWEDMKIVHAELCARAGRAIPRKGK